MPTTLLHPPAANHLTTPHGPANNRVFRGLPWLSPACSRRWLGDRWFVFSQPPQSAARLSIVSSRLAQRLDLEPWWFALLRTAVLQTDQPNTLLPIVPGTAPAEFLLRACQIFNRSPLLIQLPEHTHTPDRFPRDPAAALAWLDEAQSSFPQTHNTNSPNPAHTQLLVSPLIPSAPPDGWNDFRQAIPLADRILFALATRIIVLRCRSGGHISQLIHHHLHDSPRATVPLMVAADELGGFPDVLTRRCAGWIPWHCLPPATNCHAETEADDDDDDTGDTPLADSSTTPPLNATAQFCTTTPQPAVTITATPHSTPASDPLSAPELWLCHWTRAALGPWPGETREAFLDQCILGNPNNDRSALATLLRILSESRLRASSDAIRGGHAVTAFTQVPLAQFRARRIFRPHRRRYDFEPWGLAIRRSALIPLQARPVIYGTEDLWQNLPTADQPFFQKISHDSGLNTPAEREWRLPGDLLLSDIPHDDLVVFVDSPADALQVNSLGPWHVLVLPTTSDSTHAPKHNSLASIL